MPKNEALGLAIAAELVRRKLVLVNNANRFVLERYGKEIRPRCGKEIRPDPFIADDDRRAVRIEKPTRTPLPRLKPTSNLHR